MPASVKSENGSETVDLTEEVETGPAVTDYLDMALTAASDQGMTASELMGLFFYYAHSIADGFRQDVLAQSEEDPQQ